MCQSTPPREARSDIRAAASFCRRLLTNGNILRAWDVRLCHKSRSSRASWSSLLRNWRYLRRKLRACFRPKLPVRHVDLINPAASVLCPDRISASTRRMRPSVVSGEFFANQLRMRSAETRASIARSALQCFHSRPAGIVGHKAGNVLKAMVPVAACHMHPPQDLGGQFLPRLRSSAVGGGPAPAVGCGIRALVQSLVRFGEPYGRIRQYGTR